MSPEAIELPDGMRRLKVGRASDVWSLGCILYQMVYGHPPFQHLSVYQKMKAIPDIEYEINFPEFATPMLTAQPKQGSSPGPTTPPKKLDHLKRRVRPDVIACIQSCLRRNPKERALIPELMEQDWLAMKECQLACRLNSSSKLNVFCSGTSNGEGSAHRERDHYHSLLYGSAAAVRDRLGPGPKHGSEP
jgi:serine/threonine-protein kinase TTK/MPS1